MYRPRLFYISLSEKTDGKQRVSTSERNKAYKTAGINRGVQLVSGRSQLKPDQLLNLVLGQAKCQGL